MNEPLSIETLDAMELAARRSPPFAPDARDRLLLIAEARRLRKLLLVSEAPRVARPTPDDLARRFHETYEKLAPSFGYETREASRKPWEQVPENNRKLMTAVCAEILAGLP